MSTRFRLKDRTEAANQLLKKLSKFKGQCPLVLGIPRGAMPMAQIIANGLNGELNAILIRKIPAPFFKELAVGAVGLSGHILKLPLAMVYEIPDSYIHEEAKRQIQILRKRKEQFNLPELNCKDRTVIVVDDGIATGATALGAIHDVMAQKPAKIILAAGVVARSTADQIRKRVDELVVLAEPEEFGSVSEFFSDFSEVTDEQIFKLLKRQSLPPGLPESSI